MSEDDSNFIPDASSDNDDDFAARVRSKSKRQKLDDVKDEESEDVNSDVAETRALIDQLSPMKKPESKPKKTTSKPAQSSQEDIITLEDSPEKDSQNAKKSSKKKPSQKQSKLTFGATEKPKAVSWILFS